MSTHIPSVLVELPNGGKTSYDLYSLLLKHRIVFLCTEINDLVANNLIAQLLYLESESASKSIKMHINSPGGSISAGMAVLDVMRNVKCPVHTIVMGQAASMGAVLLACGQPGKRTALPNSTVMLHQPSISNAGGQETDIMITARRLSQTRERLEEITAASCNRTVKEIHKAFERDTWLSAEEALKFGIIDRLQPPASKTSANPAEPPEEPE